MKFSHVLLLMTAVIAAVALWPQSPAPVVAGISAPAIPVQSDTRVLPFRHKDYVITPLAEFDITARVLGSEKYYLDRGAELSPVDLALGWGRMSDPAVLRHIKITQGGRWYRWRAEQLPIPHSEITASSANMHMIPATDQIRKQLKRVDEGATISIRGKLVEVSGPRNSIWRSSLSRTDSGDGSCELIWVESVDVLR